MFNRTSDKGVRFQTRELRSIPLGGIDDGYVRHVLPLGTQTRICRNGTVITNHTAVHGRRVTIEERALQHRDILLGRGVAAAAAAGKERLHQTQQHARVAAAVDGQRLAVLLEGCLLRYRDITHGIVHVAQQREKERVIVAPVDREPLKPALREGKGTRRKLAALQKRRIEHEAVERILPAACRHRRYHIVPRTAAHEIIQTFEQPRILLHVVSLAVRRRNCDHSHGRRLHHNDSPAPQHRPRPVPQRRQRPHHGNGYRHRHPRSPYPRRCGHHRVPIGFGSKGTRQRPVPSAAVCRQSHCQSRRHGQQIPPPFVAAHHFIYEQRQGKCYGRRPRKPVENDAQGRCHSNTQGGAAAHAYHYREEPPRRKPRQKALVTVVVVDRKEYLRRHGRQPQQPRAVIRSHTLQRPPHRNAHDRKKERRNEGAAPRLDEELQHKVARHGRRASALGHAPQHPVAVP